MENYVWVHCPTTSFLKSLESFKNDSRASIFNVNIPAECTYNYSSTFSLLHRFLLLLKWLLLLYFTSKDNSHKNSEDDTIQHVSWGWWCLLSIGCWFNRLLSCSGGGCGGGSCGSCCVWSAGLEFHHHLILESRADGLVKMKFFVFSTDLLVEPV